jgi:predicted hotdog family 3-hydroxylacyl-ACP dehydratase
MCLLERVESWDAERIVCAASSHHAADNPLRAHGRLGGACGIEYAAQAMAVHGALLAPPDSKPRAGFLVSVRGVEIHVARLDDIAEDLAVSATRLMGDENNILYEFCVSAGQRLLLQGRAAVVTNAETLVRESS